MENETQTESTPKKKEENSTPPNSPEPLSLFKKNFDTLVMSSGGIKGFMILGALKYLDDHKYLKNIKKYVGTSVGAILSYLLAIGYTPIEIITYICSKQVLDKFKDINFVNIINGGGGISYMIIQEILEQMTIEKVGKYYTMETLYKKFGIHLVCVTYDYTNKKGVYIDKYNYPEMPCLVAIRMSSNIPFIFDKYKYMNSYYLDGAIFDTFPILKGEQIGSNVIGINLPINTSHRSEKNIVEYMFNLIKIPVAQNNETSCRLADKKRCHIINVEQTDILKNEKHLFKASTKVCLDMVSLGYNAAKDYINSVI